MEPELDPDEFVYCTFPSGTADRLQIDALCGFHEGEGETMILRRAEAERNKIAFAFPLQEDYSPRAFESGSGRVSFRRSR